MANKWKSRSTTKVDPGFCSAWHYAKNWLQEKFTQPSKCMVNSSHDFRRF